MDDADATSGDYAKFTANGLQGRSASEVRSDINVEDGADVTDATNVNAAGATMNTDTDVSGNSWVLDQDDMSGDDNTKVATQQSVKAYVDAQGYEWQGAWVTATAYAVNDTVENDGSGYICTSAHTSGSTTEPDVGASWSDKWDLFIEGGTNLVEQVYPVGSIYINATSSTNPATLLGFGTWSAFGAGRVLVGIDSGDGDFDTAEETGGSKTASLSASNIPSHRHEMANHRHSVSITSGTQSASHKHTVSGTFGEASNAGSTRYPVSNEHAAFTSASSFLGMSYQNASHTHSVSGNTGYYGSGNYTGYYGSGDSFDIMNPYITVYMWKRTA
jgi:hypothetical protein